MDKNAKFFFDRHIQKRNKIGHKFEHQLSFASHQLAALRKDLTEVEKRSGSLFITREKKEVSPTPLQSASHLFDALLLTNPARLITPYRVHRRFIRPSDEARWKIDYQDGFYHARNARPCIPIWTRGRDGMRFITGLEVLKDGSEREREEEASRRMALRKKWMKPEAEDEMLFERNWPLTEERTGPSFREFVNYDY